MALNLDQLLRVPCVQCRLVRSGLGRVKLAECGGWPKLGEQGMDRQDWLCGGCEVGACCFPFPVLSLPQLV